MKDRKSKDATPTPAAVRPDVVQLLAANAQLIGTRIVFQHCRATNEIFNTKAWTLEVSHGAYLASRLNEPVGAAAVFVFAFKALSSDVKAEDGQPAVLVDVHRAAAYTNIPTDATDAELQMFAPTVEFNLWPMMRADVHAFSMGLGIPPIVLPLLRPTANSSPPERPKSSPRNGDQPKAAAQRARAGGSGMRGKP